jgi:SRSO17 transposase
MLREMAALNLPVSYVTGDTLYSGHRLCKLVQRLGWDWVGVLHPNTTLIVKNRRHSAASLAASVRLKWRAQLNLRALSLTAYSPKYGHLRLVVTQNRHGNCEVLACSNRQADLTSIVLCKRSRWSIETVFRDTKQHVALGACQCRVDQALVRHVAFVFVAFIVLQMLGLHRQETVGETKARLRLSVMTYGQLPPTPLKGRVSMRELLTA